MTYGGRPDAGGGEPSRSVGGPAARTGPVAVSSVDSLPLNVIRSSSSVPGRRGSLSGMLLAGDAALLVAPIAAKGMSLAPHDALPLGDALVACLDGGDRTGWTAARRRVCGGCGTTRSSRSGCRRSTTDPRPGIRSGRGSVPGGDGHRPAAAAVHLAGGGRRPRRAMPRDGGAVLTGPNAQPRRVSRAGACPPGGGRPRSVPRPPGGADGRRRGSRSPGGPPCGCGPGRPAAAGPDAG